MDLVTAGVIVTIITGILGIAAWFNNRSKATEERIKEWTSLQLRSLGRTLDNHSSELDGIIKELAHHSHKISQSDVVMVHIDETLKQLGAAVTKLDQTLNALQVSFVRLESKNKPFEE